MCILMCTGFLPLMSAEESSINGSRELILDQYFSSASITRNMELLRDPSLHFTIEDVTKPGTVFAEALAGKQGNLGYSTDAIWIRFTVNNTGTSSFSWYLESGYPLLDEIIMYSPSRDGWEVQQTGDHFPYNKWIVKYRNPILPVISPPGKTTYYLKIISEGSQVLRFRAYTPGSFSQKKDNEIPWLWFYYGIMLSIAIYNLFIFVSVRVMTYLHLVLFIISVTLYSLIFNGMAPGLFWPDSVWITNRMNPIMVFLTCATTMLFTESFLSVRQFYPLIGRIYRLLIAFCCLSASLSLFMPYYIMTQLSVLMIFTSCISGLFAGFIIIKHDYRSAYFFIISWSLYLVGAISASLFLNAYIPDTFFANWSYQIGSALIALLLSLGIADRINTMRKEVIRQYSQIQEQYRCLDNANEELSRVHTELLEVSDQIKLEKEQLGATLCSIGDAVITSDSSGNVILMNPVAEKMTGWPLDEARGHSIRNILKFHDEKTELTFFAMIQHAADSGRSEALGVPFNLVDRNGEDHIIEVNCTRIIVPDRINYDTVMAIRDITEKYKLEREILKMNKIESLGVLAGGIAHDFNNLLTAILGNISMARTLPGFDPGFSEIIDKIDTAGQRAMNLTRQILTFSKGGAPIRKITSITTLLNECLDLSLTGSKVKCDLRIPDYLWNADVDTDQISQVFNNIILNAIQAMPGGGIITVTAENLQELPSGIPLTKAEYIRINISDTGTGIKQRDLTRIFDPFFTTKESGTGLGLASSYSIIKKHRGWIDVHSVENEGSVFSIYLQSTRRESDTAESSVSAVEKRTGKILLMDDEKYILDVTGRMLRHLGYDVCVTSDGENTVKLYANAIEENRPFDMVIMDLTIPGGMGGQETLSELKKIDPSVNAIVSSGYSEDPIMSRYKQYGFKGVLLKPYRIDDLSKIIRGITHPDGITTV